MSVRDEVPDRDSLADSEPGDGVEFVGRYGSQPPSLRIKNGPGDVREVDAVSAYPFEFGGGRMRDNSIYGQLSSQMPSPGDTESPFRALLRELRHGQEIGQDALHANGGDFAAIAGQLMGVIDNAIFYANWVDASKAFTKPGN